MSTHMELVKAQLCDPNCKRKWEMQSEGVFSEGNRNEAGE